MTTYTAAAAIAAYQSGITGTFDIVDTEADVAANLSGLETIAGAVNINTVTLTLTDPSDPITLSYAAYWSDRYALRESGTYSLIVTGIAAANADLVVSSHIISAQFSDSAANVTANLGNLQMLSSFGETYTIALTDSGTVTFNLTGSQWSGQNAVFGNIEGSFTVTVAGTSAYAAAAAVSDAYVTSLTVSDTANGVRNEIDALGTLASQGRLTSITLTDGAINALPISVSQLTTDSQALALIAGTYSLAVSGVNAANAASVAAQSHVASIAISDSSANLAANLGAIETLVTAGKVSSIGQTDYGLLALSAAQISADAAALAKFTFYGLDVTGVSAANAATVAYESGVDAVSVADTAANISTNIATLQTLANIPKIASIAVTDGGTIQVTDTYYNTAGDDNWRFYLTGNYSISISGVSYGSINSRLTDTHVSSVGVADAAFEISDELDSLELLAKAGKLASISLTDGGTPALSVSQSQLTSDADALALMTGSYTLAITGATAAGAAAAAATAHVSSVSVSDTLTDITGNLTSLETLASQGKLGSVAVANWGGTMTLTGAQFSAPLLNAMTGSFNLVLQGVTVAQALAAPYNHLQSITISDTAANVAANFDALEGLAHPGLGGSTGILTSIALTDSGTPTLTLDAEQLANDSDALAAIHSAYTLSSGAGPLSVATLAAGGGHGLSGVTVADTAAKVGGQLDLLQTDVAAGIVSHITLTDSGTPTLSIKQSQLTSDSGALAAISGSYDLALTTTAAAATSASTLSKVVSISVSDTGAQIGANLDALQALATTGQLTAVYVSDAVPVPVTVTQQTTDAAVLHLLGNANIFLDDVSAAGAVAAASPIDIPWISVSDTAANVAASLDSLETLAANGKLRSIFLTDSVTPLLPISATQMTTDAQAIRLIDSPYVLSSTGLTVAQFKSEIGNGQVSAGSIADTAANVLTNLDALAADVTAGKLTSIALTDAGTPTLAITDVQLSGDAAALNVVVGNYDLTVSGASVANLSGLTALHNVTGIGVSDTAANVSGDLDGLQALLTAGKLISLSVSDGGTLSVTAAQMVSDAQIINDIGGNYTLSVTGASISSLSTTVVAHASEISVSDSADNISSNLDTLQSYASAGKLTAVKVTDTAFDPISVTSSQLTSDAKALSELSGNFTVAIDASGANLTLSGVAGHGNTVSFADVASDYSISAAASGDTVTVTDTGTGRTSTDTLSGVTALQFGSQTDIVAQTPGQGQVTTGNVTELYSAVLGRLPDIAGLKFYENFLAQAPNTPLTTFAQWFLASPEYTSNPAHNYAQSSAGDAQFITDCYQNLLGRAPESGAIPYYENVINSFTQGMIAGTAAYAAAQTLGHAYVLSYFSASPEFLGDVTITAQNPSSTQHWLLLTNG